MVCLKDVHGWTSFASQQFWLSMQTLVVCQVKAQQLQPFVASSSHFCYKPVLRVLLDMAMRRPAAASTPLRRPAADVAAAAAAYPLQVSVAAGAEAPASREAFVEALWAWAGGLHPEHWVDIAVSANDATRSGSIWCYKFHCRSCDSCRWGGTAWRNFSTGESLFKAKALSEHFDFAATRRGGGCLLT